MSKAIKVIDLLNKIANGEDIPKKIKLSDIVYYWDIDDRCYIDEDMNNWVNNIDNKWLEARISMDSKKDLNKEVEIIEEEPEIDIQGIEELEEYSIQGLEVSGYSMTQGEYLLEDGVEENREIINELIKAVKQLDNKINNK